MIIKQAHHFQQLSEHADPEQHMRGVAVALAESVLEDHGAGDIVFSWNATPDGILLVVRWSAVVAGKSTVSNTLDDGVRLAYEYHLLQRRNEAAFTTAPSANIPMPAKLADAYSDLDPRRREIAEALILHYPQTVYVSAQPTVHGVTLDLPPDLGPSDYVVYTPSETSTLPNWLLPFVFFAATGKDIGKGEMTPHHLALIKNGMTIHHAAQLSRSQAKAMTYGLMHGIQGTALQKTLTGDGGVAQAFMKNLDAVKAELAKVGAALQQADANVSKLGEVVLDSLPAMGTTHGQYKSFQGLQQLSKDVKLKLHSAPKDPYVWEQLDALVKHHGPQQQASDYTQPSALHVPDISAQILAEAIGQMTDELIESPMLGKGGPGHDEPL